MNGYIQLTPVPSNLATDDEVLDRPAAIGDKPDQVELRKAFVDGEREAFKSWSGFSNREWSISFIHGYPTLFICLSGPWAKDGETPLDVEPQLDSWIFSIQTGAAYGDVGCSMRGVSFAHRARWEVSSERSEEPDDPHCDAPKESNLGAPLASILIAAAVTLVIALFLVLHG